MARITGGTAAFHAAALFSLWGEERGREFFEAIQAHSNYIAADDAAVLELVSSGVAHWGFIDLDLGICAKRHAQPVHIFFPDRLSLGTMTPPHVVAMLSDAPNPAQAKALFAHLFSKKTAWQLGQDDCALLTLLPGIRKPDWVPVLGGVNVAQIDNAALFNAYRDNAEFFASWGADASPPSPPAR